MKITVLGDGAWGTACAMLFAENGHTVDLWCFNEAVATEIRTKRTNSTFLPGFTIPKAITPTTDLKAALSNEIICEAIPVPYLRTVLEKTRVPNAGKKLWVILSKGLEAETHKLPTDILIDIYGKLPHVAVLSGPSFACDVANKQPTIVGLAAQSAEDMRTVREMCENKFFTCSANTDLIGTQLLGALKNVAALGTGVIAGAGFGINTRVLFVMRCFEEIAELVVTMDGQRDTLYGPAGIGDLMLTCFGSQSRNYQCGFELSKEKVGTKNSKQAITAEGLNTITSICDIADEEDIEMPVICALAEIVAGKKSVKYLIDQLIVG
jgi:glycerol-3-phosphate dehydrogenase (NAD(P)+)